MSADWPVARLGDYCVKIGSGATPKGGKNVYLESGDFALIRSQNIYNEGFKSGGLVYITKQAAEKLKNVEVQVGDVLLNITGDSVARVCLAPKSHLPARVNQHVAIIRPDPNHFDSRYLRYFLASPQQQELLLTIASSGATRNALTKGHIESLEVCKPPINIQRAIADQIEAFEAKIQLNHQINQTLEQMAQAIFKSWFVDFEPVRAKMEAKKRWQALQAGNEPASPVCYAEPEPLPDLETYMNLAAMQAISGKNTEQLARMEREQPDQYARLHATAELFPSAMQPSELGDIPEGWKVSTVGKEFDVIMGQSPPGDTYNECGEGVPFFQGRRDFGERFPSDRVYCTEPKRMAKAGDTLLSVRAPVGDTNIALTDCCIGRGLAAVRHNSGSSCFTYYSIIHLGRELASFGSEGTVFGSINQKNLKAISLVAPTAKMLAAFQRIVGIIDERIKANFKETTSLSNTRDTLLPKLLSGEITVPEAEAQLATTEEVQA